ncbi:hypothetical protein AMTR_s00925p00008640 [Amborella trichopoda]|uniref:Uncharacterized protein n=1 Tax=Amborella trichopoda TaxID=13333 RepID=W1PGB4_AMBTC|nr:hypothetical protein AMTR_s00925p00008640 [Amborella trichopoda]
MLLCNLPSFSGLLPNSNERDVLHFVTFSQQRHGIAPFSNNILEIRSRRRHGIAPLSNSSPQFENPENQKKAMEALF